MRVVPVTTNSSSLHSQLTAIMETMARSALSQISKLVDEDSLRLRFDLSKALFTNSALSERVKRLECVLASRESSRSVGVQTDAPVSAAPASDRIERCVNMWRDDDDDPLCPDTVTDLPHTSKKSSDTFSAPIIVTEDKCEDSVLSTAINREQELIDTEEYVKSTSMESEQQLLCYSAQDSDCSLSFDHEDEAFDDEAAASENSSTHLIHCDTEAAFSSHVIPIEEDDDDDDDDDDDVQFVQESHQEPPTNVATGGPSIGERRTIPPYKDEVAATWDNGIRHRLFAPDAETDRTSHSVKFTCKICRRTFFYKRTLTRHMKSHKSNFCKICKQHFPQRTKFKPHVCVPKLPNKKVVGACQICGKLCPNPSSLRIHSLVHTGEKPHRCGLCGKSFTQKGNLKCHLRIHTGERPFQCSLCGKTFVQKINLNGHMMAHRRESRGQEPAALS